jgi:hypothetical protein
LSTYSTLFFTGGITTAEAVLWVAPAGTSVLRDLEVWNSGSSSAQAQFFLRSIPGFDDSYLIRTPELAGDASWQWEGRVVIPATGHLTAMAVTGTFFVTASGYALS